MSKATTILQVKKSYGISYPFKKKGEGTVLACIPNLCACTETSMVNLDSFTSMVKFFFT